jgi:hypothetical protein
MRSYTALCNMCTKHYVFSQVGIYIREGSKRYSPGRKEGGLYKICLHNFL